MGIKRAWDRELEILGRAESWLQLKNSFRSLLSEIAFQAEEEDPYLQVELISRAYRLVTRRAGELLHQRYYRDKFELSDITWLSLGGEARREATFRFDQDNAIIFSQAKEDFCCKYAEDLVERLSWLGLRLCDGGIMASNPNWQRTMERWEKLIQSLAADSMLPEGIRRATILYDIDYIFGERLYYKKLIRLLKETFKRSTILQRKMAEDIINIPSYIGLFGRLALETRAD